MSHPDRKGKTFFFLRSVRVHYSHKEARAGGHHVVLTSGKDVAAGSSRHGGDVCVRVAASLARARWDKWNKKFFFSLLGFA